MIELKAGLFAQGMGHMEITQPGIWNWQQRKYTLPRWISHGNVRKARSQDIMFGVFG
jgi:hypothetical protein